MSPNRTLKFYYLVGIILIFLQVNVNQSQDSVYFKNSTKKFDYISLISDVTRRYKRQNLNSGVNCELPSDPLHGRFTILGDSATNYKPGDLVQQFISLQLQCSRGYAISPFQQSIAICINGIWSPSLAACLRTCPTLISTKTTTVKCRLNNQSLDNCISPVTGTRAALSCNSLYEEPNIQKSPIRVCRGNRWYPSTSTCYPTCGIKNPKGNPNIVGGQNVTVGDFPWQIGIYNSTTKAFICGGSIIEQNVILTAAHCVTNYDGVIQPAAQYSVAAGKYFSRYDEPRDLFAQYSNVLTIHVPDRYTGLINAFALDIAVLILQTHFTLSASVQPICISLNDNPTKITFLSASDNGIVTGWGYTSENGDVSDILKELTIPLIPFLKCSREVPESFRRYFTVDKICGGYLNSSTSICRGDSGGALVFKNLIDNRYYVRGIVSTSPASEASTCDSNQYSLYTSVDQHIDFVRDLVTDNQFRTPVECFGDECQNEENLVAISTYCQIPNYGPHIRYVIVGELGNSFQIPGDDVPQYSTLEIICDKGYKPSAFSDLRTICVSGNWSHSLTLTCLQTCPSLNSTISTSVTCKYHDVTLENCHNPVDQTTALLLCNPLYEGYIKNALIHTCAAGYWIPAIYECDPICGVRSPNKKINGQNDNWEDYPSNWLAGIYNLQKELICSGSIIDRHLILTAAHCVADFDGHVLPVERYLIAAGKYYRAYEDDRAEFTQYSKVRQIYIPEGYKGINGSVGQDIAIIVLTDPFTISEAVQPVCMELLQGPQISPNLSGTITGWGYIQEARSISKVRKELVVPIIPFDRCSDEVPSAGICTDFLSQGISFCDGDTGGGLILKDTPSERHFIEGISSKAPVLPKSAPECEGNQFFHHSTLLFTSFKDHNVFIKNVKLQNLL